jgi:hypothetical protein
MHHRRHQAQQTQDGMAAARESNVTVVKQTEGAKQKTPFFSPKMQ